MQLRFNPRRTALVLALFGLWWLWATARNGIALPNLHLPAFSLSHLDQAHTIAALAVIGIAVVGIVKLLTRR